MMPPEAPETDADAPEGTTPPAASVCDTRPAPRLSTLRKRADFLAARVRRRSTPSLILEARRRREGEATGIRVGFTCSKKLGNAVARNRAKRRLRAAARAVLPLQGLDGWDYVLVGRREITATRSFRDLLTDLDQALAGVHAPPKPKHAGPDKATDQAAGDRPDRATPPPPRS